MATGPALYFFDPATIQQADASSSDRWLFRDEDEWPGTRYERGDEVLHIALRNWADLLIVAPLDAKARVTEPYVGCYLHASKDGRTNLSEVVAMTAREFEDALLAPASAG